MSKYSNYDYVRADMDYYNIPERYEARLRELFEKDDTLTFRYNEETDICVYSSWQDCYEWRDVYTNDIVEWDDFFGQYIKPTNSSDKKQVSLVPVKTKKKSKIAEPVEELYNKVVPKKPLEIKVYQKA